MPWLTLPKKDVQELTIIVGELLRSIDPAVSEWGNPSRFISGYIRTKLVPSGTVIMRMWEPPELKHLSRGRNINQTRFRQ
jgi:hypothetical protein